MPPLMLLDSASLYFRAFYGVPELRAPDGTPVHAVRGFLDTVARLVAQWRPGRVVACWDDDWRPEFRVAALPSYKAHRLAADGAEDVPDLLTPQVPVIVDALAAIGIARLGAPGYEADDVIATLAQRAAATDGEVEIVSGDRDLFQLVDDASGIRVLYPTRGGWETVDQEWLRQRYQIPSGSAYADLAVLRGDPSDGLPGVPGIGEKTAAALLRRYGDLEAILASLDDDDAAPAQRGRLLAARDYLQRACAVVRVVRDIPLPEVDDRLPAAPADPDRVAALAERWGLSGPLTRLVEAMSLSAG